MPQSLPFTPRITQAGLNAAVTAAGLQISVQVTHIALGTGQYNPTGTETALADRRLTSPIAGGGEITPTQLRLHAAFQAAPGESFNCGEIGFYLGHPDSGGTLLAVYSTTNPAVQPIVFVSDQFLVTNSYTLGLSALPAGSVTVLVDQNAQAILLLIGNHETGFDPHGDRQFAAMADAAHVDAVHPHSQYLRASDMEAIAIYTLRKEYSGGGVYTTYDDTRSPAEILGFGTWALCGVGRVFVGQDPAQVEFQTVGQLGGAKTHTLSTAQMPAHTHQIGSRDAGGAEANGGSPNQELVADFGYAGVGAGPPATTSSVGSGEAHNNLQPYEVVRKWRCLSVDNTDAGGGSSGGGSGATPTPFSFANVFNRAANTLTLSESVQVFGLGDETGAVSINGGEYSRDGLPFTAVSGIITNGDLIQIRTTSSPTSGATRSVTLTIGSFSTVWQVMTASAAGVDTVPNAFSFTSQSGVNRNATVISNIVTVGGVNAPTPISITGGMYSINLGPWTSAAGTITNGQQVRVQLVTASTGSTSRTATLNIGGVTGSFTATTTAETSFNMTASPNPVSAIGNATGGPVTLTSLVSLSIVNGTAPFSTVVTLVSDGGNASGITATVLASNSVRFRSSGFNNSTYDGVWRITTSDSVGNSRSRDVPVTHTYFNAE